MRTLPDNCKHPVVKWPVIKQGKLILSDPETPTFLIIVLFVFWCHLLTSINIKYMLSFRLQDYTTALGEEVIDFKKIRKLVFNGIFSPSLHWLPIN